MHGGNIGVHMQHAGSIEVHSGSETEVLGYMKTIEHRIKKYLPFSVLQTLCKPLIDTSNFILWATFVGAAL